jgi:hypothetical protein
MAVFCNSAPFTVSTTSLAASRLAVTGTGVTPGPFVPSATSLSAAPSLALRVSPTADISAHAAAMLGVSASQRPLAHHPAAILACDATALWKGRCGRDPEADVVLLSALHVLDAKRAHLEMDARPALAAAIPTAGPQAPDQRLLHASQGPEGGPASPSRPPHETDAEDVADPQTELERAIEDRNFDLLRAGGELEECGKKVYHLRLMIEREMPTDALVPPELRAGRVQEAKERLLELLEGHANLKRVDPQQLQGELAAFHKRFKPISSRSSLALQHVVHILRARLAETQGLLTADIARRQEEIQAESRHLKTHGGRASALLALQAQLRELKELKENIGELLDVALQADPRSFLTEAQKVIKKAERLALVSEAASAPGWERVPAKRGSAAKKPNRPSQGKRLKGD